MLCAAELGDMKRLHEVGGASVSLPEFTADKAGFAEWLARSNAAAAALHAAADPIERKRLLLALRYAAT